MAFKTGPAPISRVTNLDKILKLFIYLQKFKYVIFLKITTFEPRKRFFKTNNEIFLNWLFYTNLFSVQGLVCR